MPKVLRIEKRKVFRFPSKILILIKAHRNLPVKVCSFGIAHLKEGRQHTRARSIAALENRELPEPTGLVSEHSAGMQEVVSDCRECKSGSLNHFKPSSRCHVRYTWTIQGKGDHHSEA